MNGYPLHPLAEAIPAASEADYKSLRNSIERDGLETPITLFDGKVLDGRNRQRACLELGVPLRTEEFNGEDPAAFVFRQNVARRHLTQSQKVLVALKFEELFAEDAKERKREGGRRGGELAGRGRPIGMSHSWDKPIAGELPSRSARRAADMVGVAHGYVSKAKRVRAEAPDLFERMESGDLTVSNAHSKLVQRQKPKPETAVSDSIKIPNAPDVSALKLVEKATQASRQMWTSRDEVLAAIGIWGDSEGVSTLAAHLGWSIHFLREMEVACLQRLTPNQRKRRDALVAAGTNGGHSL